MQSQNTLQQKSAILFPVFGPLHKPEVISQEELGLLLSLRGRLKQLQEQIAAEEESLEARLSVGAVIEPGDHTAELKENSRRNVAWKDVAIRLADRLKLDGEMYCARVLAATKPTRTVTLIVD